MCTVIKDRVWIEENLCSNIAQYNAFEKIDWFLMKCEYIKNVAVNKLIGSIHYC